MLQELGSSMQCAYFSISASSLSSDIMLGSTVSVHSTFKNSCSGLNVETGSVTNIFSSIMMFGKVCGAYAFNAAMAVTGIFIVCV
jgi:hypothetical protein